MSQEETPKSVPPIPLAEELADIKRMQANYIEDHRLFTLATEGEEPQTIVVTNPESRADDVEVQAQWHLEKKALAKWS